MNLAQIVNPLGHGCFEWRLDLLPAKSVLAYEVGRLPAPRRTQTAVAAVEREPRAAQEPSDSITGMALKMLSALRAAWRTREKLGFSEVCERVGCARSKYAHETLEKLHLRGLVHTDGKNRGTVYWADDVEEEAA